MEFTCILKAIFSSNIWKCIDRKKQKDTENNGCAVRVPCDILESDQS